MQAGRLTDNVYIVYTEEDWASVENPFYYNGGRDSRPRNEYGELKNSAGVRVSLFRGHVTFNGGDLVENAGETFHAHTIRIEAHYNTRVREGLRLEYKNKPYEIIHIEKKPVLRRVVITARAVNKNSVLWV